MKEFFMRFPGFKTRAFTMSYDDGTVFDKKMVEILDRYNLKCTFNLNSGSIGKENHLSEEEIKTLYTNHEIAVHTYDHPHLDNLDNAGIMSQVLKDRENLERIFGRIIKGMAYPFCLNSDRVRECVRMCGIDYARTVESIYNFSLPEDFLAWNPTIHFTDKKLYEMIDSFFAPDDVDHPWRIETKLFYLWGHSYEFENRFYELENFCKKAANKPNVWYADNGEVFRYIRDYRRLEFSANGNIINNPTNTDIYAFCNNKNVFIPANSVITID